MLALLDRGNSNLDIAAGFFLSEATVKIQVDRVLAKLGIRDRVQAMVTAHVTGVARP